MNLYEKVVGFFKSSSSASSDDFPKDLSTLRVVDLRSIAKSKGLRGYTHLKKVELVDLLYKS